jgi:murein DD-endopeptidase MepM/ murein hydrolase activator NlpD
MSPFRSIALSRWLTLLLFAVCARVTASTDTTRTDTVSALVVYGDSKLLEADAALTDERLDELLDSLCTMDRAPKELIQDLLLFKRIRGMGVDQMVLMIDSLFELETVPYALINEINLYASNMPTQLAVDHALLLPWSITNVEPGAEVYGAWNPTQPNAYGPELSAKDTVVLVKLTEGPCGFRMPVPPILTSRFGTRDGRPHNGIDLDLVVGDPVSSAFPGVVRYAGTCGGFGRLVVVRHYNGLETYYAHLHRLKVKSGDVVDAGDVIGLGGNSGHSTGSHLHFEVRFKGIPIDPSHLIAVADGELLCDTLVLKKTRWSYAAYPMGTRFHTVGKGEHLYAIAEQYGTSIDALCELNGISRRTHLRIGQRLMVSAAPARGDVALLR